MEDIFLAHFGTVCNQKKALKKLQSCKSISTDVLPEVMDGYLAMPVYAPLSDHVDGERIVSSAERHPASTAAAEAAVTIISWQASQLSWSVIPSNSAEPLGYRVYYRLRCIRERRQLTALLKLIVKY